MLPTLSRSEVYSKQHYAIDLSVTRWKIVFFSWQSENILNNDFWFKMDEQHNDQKKSVKRQTTMGKTLHTQLNFNQHELHQTQDVKSGTSERQEIHASDIGSL